MVRERREKNSLDINLGFYYSVYCGHIVLHILYSVLLPLIVSVSCPVRPHRTDAKYNMYKGVR
jgi:hypothetical protein